MTLEEKLEKFLEGPIGFRLKSEEITDELAKVLDGDDRFKDKDWAWKELCSDARKRYGDKALIAYDATGNFYGSTYTIGDMIDPVDVTLDELKAYNG